MALGIWSKNVVSRVFTKIKEKLEKVNLRKGANLRLLLQPPEEFLGRDQVCILRNLPMQLIRLHQTSEYPNLFIKYFTASMEEFYRIYSKIQIGLR